MFINFGPVKECESCKTLRQQLEFANYQNQQLLNTILEMNRPKVIETFADTEAPVALPNTRFANFAEKRKQLEEQSRIEAQRLTQLKKDTETSTDVTGIEELEDMVGVGEK